MTKNTAFDFEAYLTGVVPGCSLNVEDYPNDSQSN